jgi:hypothetical protein
MAHLHEDNTLRDVVRWEDNEESRASREVVTVLSGQDLVMGQVIGVRSKSCPTTGTADAGNTGAGTMASVTAGAKAQLGTYTITCTNYVASPLEATFEVKGPDGNSLPDASLAAYVNEQLNFDIGDASPAITVGDIWTVAITAGTGYAKELTPAAVDGTQDAYGILVADCDASLGNTAAAVIVKDAMIIAANLTWTSGMSAGEKTAALAQLAAKGITAVAEA